MKKLLALLLCLAMTFCMFGCGQKQGETETGDQTAETFTSIPLGGDLEDFELNGPCFGKEYVKIDAPKAMLSDIENVTTDVYYCADSFTPYIVVYRGENVTSTLEELTKAISEAYTNAYQMSTWDIGGETREIGYFNSVLMNGEGVDDECYYCDSTVFIDGDNAVEIDFYTATEELQLDEETNQYLWVPKGYDADINASGSDNGLLFFGVYDESFYLPAIGVGEYVETYEAETKGWEYYFPEGLPFTKEQYNKWVDAKWENGADEEYYKALGLTIDHYGDGEINGCKYYKYSGEFKGKGVVDTFIYTSDDRIFEIWLESDLDPTPQYGKIVLTTLHSK